MSSAVSPYGLRSRKTQPKGLINHFDLTEIAEVKVQASEYNAFKQAIQAAKSENKVSRITSITLPIPRMAESGVLPPRPQLRDFSHIMTLLSDIRSQFLNPEAIADNHAHWDTLNIPVFNQERAKASVHPTTQLTTKRRITEILAVTNSTSPQPRSRTRTPATFNPSPTPSSSGSELSSVDESILADTPEAFQDTASTTFTSSPSPTPKACRPRPRLPRGPRLGFFVEPANAEAPFFDYCAASCALREHKLRIEREAATRRRHSELRSTILKAVKGVRQTPVEATALAVNHEDGEKRAREQTTARTTDQQGVDITQAPNQATTTANDHEDKDTSHANEQATTQETDREDGEDASSYGDPMDIDELDTAGVTQPLCLLIPQSENPRARQPLRASATRLVPPLRHHQPTWHQIRPLPHDEQFQKRKRAPDDEKDVSIQDILQTEVKKVRKEKSRVPTAASALGLAGTRRHSGWQKGLMESVVEAVALKGSG